MTPTKLSGCRTCTVARWCGTGKLSRFRPAPRAIDEPDQRMKTFPPTCPEPESGRKYWRSLDELAETPEFRQWGEREFPPEASEWSDPGSRRHFVKIISASFLLGRVRLAATGSRRRRMQ